MSPREQKLLIFFGLAGFAILNILAISFSKTKRLAVETQLGQAREKLAIAETLRESRELVADEIEWLADNEPEPAANQHIQTNLQQLAEREAKATGLTIKTQKPLPTDATAGKHYHRAKIQITVTGSEEALYRWFDRLNVPNQFRIASQIRMSPNPQDDTKIDCTATIEQWFVPSAI